MIFHFGLKVASNYLLRIAKAEKDVENLLKAFLPGTPFAGKVKAAGGYTRDEYLKMVTENANIEVSDLDLVVLPTPGHEKDSAGAFTALIHETFPDSTTKPHPVGKTYPIYKINFTGDITHKGVEYKTGGAELDISNANPDWKETGLGYDFTVNMLLKDLTTGEVEDLTGTSRDDIQKGILRGHPGISLNKIFSDHPIRMLRLIRFQSKYGWDIPKSVIRAVKNNAANIKEEPSEKIGIELEKIMKLGKLKQATQYMRITGLLDYLLPEIQKLTEVPHITKRDVYRHTLEVLDKAKPGVENQLAALLHDVGKPATQQLLEDRIHFTNHDGVGSEIARAIMTRFNFDKKTIEDVANRVKNHMRPHALAKGEVSEKALRKFIRDVGDSTVDAVLDLAHADELASLPDIERVPDLRKKLKTIMESATPVKTKAIMDGKEIMDLVGIKGPEVGIAKEFLKDLEDEYASKGKTLTKEEASTVLLEKYKKKVNSSKVITAYISKMAM